MKKCIIIALISIMISGFHSSSHAEEVGLWNVIFEEKVATESVAHSFLINQLSYYITTLHLTIAGKNSDTANYQSEILSTIKKLEELTKTNVIEMLDLSVDKNQALHMYLTQCDQQLQKWDMISAYIQQETQLLKWDMEACLVDKNTSNQTYFDAIDRYDQKTMETAVIESIAYENCATENRIQYNAKTSVARKLVFYLWLLQKKYDILFDKQEIVAKNFQIFRDGILPDLNQIDELLQQYNF